MQSRLVHEALESSTSHGLPRAVTAQSRLMRLIWMALFVASVVIFVCHARLLINRYNQFSLVTQSDLRKLPFEFPDIFVCHNTPISQSYTIQQMLQSPKKLKKTIATVNEYSDRQKWIVDKSGVNASYPVMPDDHFFWESVYFFPFLSNISHQPAQTLVSLAVQDRKVDILRRVETVQNRHHFYCFKVSVSSKEMGFLNERVDLALFSDDDESRRFQKILVDLNLENRGHFGLKLYFTERGKQPNLETRYVNIRPGYYYDIALEMTRTQLYPTPRRPCFVTQTTFQSALYTDHQITRSDTYEICLDVTVQKLLLDACACYDIWLTHGMVLLEVRNTHPACFNISLNSSEPSEDLLVERYSCYAHFIASNYTKVANAQCREHIACTRQTYQPFWSFIKWPTEHSIDQSLAEILLPSYRDRLARNISVSAWKYVITELEGEEQNKFFRMTFSEVTIRAKQFFSALKNERLHYPLINLFSDIGGILGLYLGMSILTIFELLELVHNYLMTAFQACQRKWSMRRASATQRRDKHGRRTGDGVLGGRYLPSSAEGVKASRSSMWI